LNLWIIIIEGKGKYWKKEPERERGRKDRGERKLGLSRSFKIGQE